jgi:hypothetical protein
MVIAPARPMVLHVYSDGLVPERFLDSLVDVTVPIATAMSRKYGARANSRARMFLFRKPMELLRKRESNFAA